MQQLAAKASCIRHTYYVHSREWKQDIVYAYSLYSVVEEKKCCGYKWLKNYCSSLQTTLLYNGFLRICSSSFATRLSQLSYSLSNCSSSQAGWGVNGYQGHLRKGNCSNLHITLDLCSMLNK